MKTNPKLQKSVATDSRVFKTKKTDVVDTTKSSKKKTASPSVGKVNSRFAVNSDVNSILREAMSGGNKAGTEGHGSVLLASAQAKTEQTSSPATTQRQWNQNIERWTGELREAVSESKGQNPLQTVLNLPRRMGRAHELQDWITNSATGDPPRKGDHEFDTATRETEQKLGNWVLSQKEPVSPGDLLKQSFRLSDGDYFNGMLTAHNLTKNLAASERAHRDGYDIWEGHDIKNGQKEGAVQQRDRQITDRLVSLRPSDSNNGDKMGPFYHIFALGLVDYASGGSLNHLASFAENLDRTHGNDLEEARINRMAADAFTLGDALSNGINEASRFMRGRYPSF